MVIFCSPALAAWACVWLLVCPTLLLVGVPLYGFAQGFSAALVACGTGSLKEGVLLVGRVPKAVDDWLGQACGVSTHFVPSSVQSPEASYHLLASLLHPL